MSRPIGVPGAIDETPLLLSFLMMVGEGVVAGAGAGARDLSDVWISGVVDA